MERKCLQLPEHRAGGVPPLPAAVAEGRRAFCAARPPLPGPTCARRPRARPAAGLCSRRLGLALREGGPTFPSQPPLPTKVTEGLEAPPAFLRGPRYSRRIPPNSLDSRDAVGTRQTRPLLPRKSLLTDCWNRESQSKEEKEPKVIVAMKETGSFIEKSPFEIGPLRPFGLHRTVHSCLGAGT